MKNKITKIKKRDGRVVDFNKEKIAEAIFKALTATDEGGRGMARRLTNKVVDCLNKRFSETKIPTVENVQDIVEEVLILENLTETAKAYILYREQRRRIREAQKATEEALETIDSYIEEQDWQVKENANMAFSLQGLNHYLTSAGTKKYWLNKVYPEEIRKAALDGDFHIHNLDTLATYCCGWDLYDLLLKGFGGVATKLVSYPPKHFKTALGQLVNFLYTVQGESAGAQAISSFDTLLAPFIRYDNLNYQQVKQAMQEFIFNCAVPTRVGFQCISEDTEILTPGGWKQYNEIKKGDMIKTLNIKSKNIEEQKVTSVFKKYYQGTMYRLQNRIQDQLISPGHRVIRKKFNTNKYVLEPIEEAMKLKTPFIIPIAGKNNQKGIKISDNQVRLMAWIISEGTIERPTKYRCCYRVSIYQSEKKNKNHYDEIIRLLKRFRLQYSEYTATGLGEEVKRVRLNAESSRKIHQWFGTKENIHFIPDNLLNLSQEQSKLFLKTYLKADGFEEHKISTTDFELLNALQIMTVNAGYGFTVLTRKPTIGKKNIYVLRLIKHSETSICRIKKINYKGIIWCPHTKNETIIARRNGKVFITGNTPFLNVTLDINPSPTLANQPIIIGGKAQDETYKEFQEEMNVFNQAFAEIMSEGDANGRVFTFPIPTINITKEFDWNSPALEGIWEMTAKYGIPYFANFIQSDMKPEDVRSMCFTSDTKIIYKEEKYNRYQRTTIRNLVNNWNYSKEFSILMNGEWVKITNAFKLKNGSGKIIKVFLRNGEIVKMTPDHPAMIVENGKLKQVSAQNLKVGDLIPIAKKGYEGKLGDFDLGRWLGLYISEGGITKGNTIYFSFNKKEKELQNFVKKIAEERFALPVHITNDPRWETCQVWVKSKAMAEWIKKFCLGKTALEKHLCSPCYGMSKDFRLGILTGIYQGDGYPRDMDFHTTNRKLRNDVADLARSLGLNYTKRTNQKNTKGEKKFTSYVLRLCKDSLKTLKSSIEGIEESCSSIYKDFGKIYGIKIKSIKIENYNASVYDLEVKSKQHLFQLANGIITHNCCRLRLSNKELYHRGGGLFGSNPLTGSIGVVTTGLPRIGYTSKNKKEFLEKLGRVMDLAKESLEIKRKALENFIEKGLYPYSKFYLSGIKKIRGSYWGNHFSTIGLVGMNEALLNFMKENIGSPRGQKFALEILDFMRDRIVKYQEETGSLYNLEATPAESSLAPNEKVLIAQSDPKLIKIGPLVDKYLKKNKEKIRIIGKSEVLPLANKELYTYGFNRKDSKIKKYPVTALIRHSGDSMYELIASSGRKVKVTKYHSVFTLNKNGLPQEIKVEQLKKGDVIAIPKKIEMETQYTEFNLIEEFKNYLNIEDKLYLKTIPEMIEKLISNKKVKEWAENYYNFKWTEIKYFWRKKNIIPLKMIYDSNISLGKNVLKNSEIFYRKSKNTKSVKALIKIDKHLGFILGAILAEGWLDSDRIEFTNTDKKMVEELNNALEKTFGKKEYVAFLKDRRGYKQRFGLTLNKMASLTIKEIIGLKGKSSEKTIPSFAYFTSSEFISGLLRGFSLGDGYEYENKKKNDRSFRLYTNSKNLLEGLNILLLRLGVLAKIKIDKKDKYNPRWKRNYILSITGTNNLRKFYSLILKKKFKGTLTNSARERIPNIAKSLKDLMNRYNLNTKDLKKLGIDKDSFNRNVRINMISWHYLKEILEKLEKRIKDPLIYNLKTLVEGDLYWDPIKSIRKTRAPRYVYDFEVNIKGSLVENFLGGEGLVCLHNTAYRLAKLDKKKYPDIITAGEKEPYYTNSSQLPVNYTDDFFEALKLQDELQCKYTGGTVLHGFIGERIPNGETVKLLVKKVFENFKLPYFTITPTFSICPHHGYIAGEHFTCPKCIIEQPCEVYSRIVGYLRPVRQWNAGKQEEFADRKTFKIS